MNNLKPENNRHEEEDNDGMGVEKEENAGLLRVHEFVERGVQIDPKWTGFDALVAAVELASQKYVEEEETIKKIREHASCSNAKPVGEILMRKNALKRPMRETVDFREAIPPKEKLMSSAIKSGSRMTTAELNCKKMNTSSRGQKRSASRQMGPEQIPDLPQSFRNLIESLQGKDVKLVIQKVLYESDLNASSRMSIPDKQVREPFLYPNEIQLLDRQCRLPIKKFIGPSLDIFQGIELSRWKLRKANGTTSYQNVLINKWNDFRIKYGLTIDDLVQVWSFRINEDLCLALVRLTNPESQHSQDK